MLFDLQYLLFIFFFIVCENSFAVNLILLLYKLLGSSKAPSQVF